jgi:hypothetical protein
MREKLRHLTSGDVRQPQERYFHTAPENHPRASSGNRNRIMFPFPVVE